MSSKTPDFEIVIDRIPPSVNHMYVITKRMQKVPTKTAREFIQYVRDLAFLKAREKQFVKRTNKQFFKMEIDFVFPSYRFPDPNNLLKALIDAFEGVVFENDKWCLPAVTSAKVQKGVSQTTVRFYF
jgi:Holliday junction resolvase RusA-like endonuclease